MEVMLITKARNDIYSLVRRIKENHEPTLIVGKDTQSVLISKEDWDSIRETIYVLKNTGLADSIREEPCKFSLELYD